MWPRNAHSSYCLRLRQPPVGVVSPCAAMPAKRKAPTPLGKAKRMASSPRPKGDEHSSSPPPAKSGIKRNPKAEVAGTEASNPTSRRSTPRGKTEKKPFLGKGDVLSLGKGAGKGAGRCKSKSNVAGTIGAGAPGSAKRSIAQPAGGVNGLSNKNKRSAGLEKDSEVDNEDVEEQRGESDSSGGLEGTNGSADGEQEGGARLSSARGKAVSKSNGEDEDTSASLGGEGDGEEEEGDVEDSDGEESEQDLQSFKEAFPGMESEEEDGGSAWLGGGGGGDSDSDDSEEDDEEGDNGLMQVRYVACFLTLDYLRASHIRLVVDFRVMGLPYLFP